MTQQGIAQQFSPEERRTYIGASEVAAILGVDTYRSPIDVYNEKLGRVAPFAGNSHTERGTRLEAIAAEFYTEHTGIKSRRHNQPFIHPEHSFLVGHVDRIAVGEKRLLEIKCPSIAAFRKFQREGLPKSYVIQAQMYLGLSGHYQKLTYVIFCADAWDAAIFDIEFDQKLYDLAVEKAVAFWNGNVLTETPPAIESEDKDQIEISKIGGEATIRDDEAFVHFANDLREAKQLKEDAEELYSMALANGLDLIEQVPGVYMGGGLTLHFKEQPGRTSFDKKALASAHPEINLTQFEKQGKPFKTTRVFFSNSN